MWWWWSCWYGTSPMTYALTCCYNNGSIDAGPFLSFSKEIRYLWTLQSYQIRLSLLDWLMKHWSSGVEITVAELWSCSEDDYIRFYSILFFLIIFILFIQFILFILFHIFYFIYTIAFLCSPSKWSIISTNCTYYHFSYNVHCPSWDCHNKHITHTHPSPSPSPSLSFPF